MNGNKDIFLSKPSAPPFDEFVEEIRPIWESRMFTNVGEKHIEFEKNLCHYFSCDNITLTSNGHLALEVALSSLNLSGEVITTPFTFASTIMAILRSGLKPVFCDINPLTLLIDANKIEALISDKTTAILPVHLFGHVCDIDAIESIAMKYGVKTIYDGAHSFGSQYKGKSTACYGDACMFSFHATKVFHSIEGGAVSFRNVEDKRFADKVKTFGLVGDDVECIGFNAKMTDISAAMGICNLRHVSDYIKQREECVREYDRNLSQVAGIRLINEQDYEKVNFSYYPIVIENEYGHTRDELEVYMVQNGIHPRKYYKNVANEWDIISEMGIKFSCPCAEEIAKKILVLPLNQDLKMDDVKRICDVINDFR